MTGKPGVEPQEWTEVGILPSDPAQREALLLDVVDPLIHETLSGHIESWHYFWEVDPIKMLHVRLRVLWLPGQSNEGRATLTASLNEAEAARSLWRWYPGSHGVPGEQYEGEVAAYDGPRIWRVTYRDWQAGSDLALALLKIDAEGRLEKGRQSHLARRVHLHSNRLGMSYRDEGNLYLSLAIGYLTHGGFSADAHLYSNRLDLSYRDEGNLYLSLAICYLARAGLSADTLHILRQIKDAIDKALAVSHPHSDAQEYVIMCGHHPAGLCPIRALAGRASGSGAGHGMSADGR